MNVARTAGEHGSAELYAHKLFAPDGDASAIPREAILDRVFGDPAVRVVLLQGPAGHGKTSTLQQIRKVCRSRGQRAGWLTFDEADNDLRRFNVHVQALIADVCRDAATPKRGPAAKGSVRRGYRGDDLLQRLHQCGRPIALFLDEFQALSDGGILAFWRCLFEHVPANVCFYVGSRSLPEIGLARLLASRRALLLRADDLRFSPGEVERFFAGTRDVEVSREEVGAIYRHTEGWPAAVQLFRLSLASPSVRRSLDRGVDCRPRELAEYLADNVLALQPDDVRDFLLRTSLLTRLSAPLCDLVTGRRDSRDMLLHLERSGLFLRSLDPELHWFRYHALFATFMAEQLRAQSRAACEEVHRLAADWYLAEGLYGESIHHALACGNATLAADTLDHWASRLVAGGHLRTVERWAERLPPEEIARRPDLAVKVAYALVFLRRRCKLPAMLKLLEAIRDDPGTTTDPNPVLSMAAVCADDLPRAFDIVERIPIHEPRPDGFTAFELGAAANLAGFRDGLLGRFEPAHEDMALARAHSERGDASFSGGYMYAVKGMNLLAQGNLREALTVFRQGTEEQDHLSDRGFSSTALVSCHVWVLYEADRLDRVERLFERERDLIFSAVLLDFLAVAVLAMARTQDARGRPMRALETLDEAENVARLNGWQRLLRVVTWERVRRFLLAGRLDKANAAAAGLRTPWPLPEGWVPFSEEAGGESLGRIRLALCNLDLDAAATWLNAELRRDDARRYRRIRLYLFEARLHEHRGNRGAAHRSLRKALQLGEPEGFVRCFLDEGDAVLHLLREEYQMVLAGDEECVGARRDYLERLLQASGTDLSRSPAAAPTMPIDALTEREREILVFLANGVSNKEMARRVFISENTVKFHLKNIYSKLAVGSRLQAIAAARQQGLIH